MRRGIVYTLVFIKTKSQILLGFKKRGLGADKWNGFGGKVEKGETILEGAKRETKEESNLTVNNLKHIAVLTYEDNKTTDIVHIFTTNSFSGHLSESEEMYPKWFGLSEVPFEKMWPDQIFWHSLMQSDVFFHAHTIYEDNEFKDCCVKQFDNINDVLLNVEALFVGKTKTV